MLAVKKEEAAVLYTAVMNWTYHIMTHLHYRTLSLCDYDPSYNAVPVHVKWTYVPCIVLYHITYSTKQFLKPVLQMDLKHLNDVIRLVYCPKSNKVRL